MDKIFLSLAAGFVLGFSITNFFPNQDTDLVHEHNEVHQHEHGEHSHMHDQIEVAAEALKPTVSIEVTGDEKSGYNVKINTENFLFTPESVNKAVAQNEGHGHIFVNGEKVARVYSEWFHLEDTLFVVGENDVRVTLNANDHSEWAIGGESISSSAVILK